MCPASLQNRRRMLPRQAKPLAAPSDDLVSSTFHKRTFKGLSHGTVSLGSSRRGTTRLLLLWPVRMEPRSGGKPNHAAASFFRATTVRVVPPVEGVVQG